MSGVEPRPLRGTLVVDASRMLPGAVAARMLAELGARIVKIESPENGDPMRRVEPRVDGTGAMFRAWYRGAESVCLDLRQPGDAERLRRLAGHADVLMESFRPGTLASWGLAPAELAGEHPRLVVCSLSSFGQQAAEAGRVAHDLNLVAAAGLLSLLPGDGVPRVQIADVSAGMLACSAILAALLGRERSGRGGWIDQPLATGPLPFLATAREELAAGGGGTAAVLLSGRCAAYRLYTCGDGKRLAVAVLEPKFWAGFVELLGLGDHIEAGLDPGPAGQAAARAVAEHLAKRPRDHWLAAAAAAGLPLSAVRELGAADDGAFFPSAGAPLRGEAPALGEHTAKVLAEFGRH